MPFITRRTAFMTVPFVVLFALVFLFDLASGFRFGLMGNFRVVWATSNGRASVWWHNIKEILMKYALLSPLMLLLILTMPFLFVLFLIYDCLCVLVLSWDPTLVHMRGPSGHTRFDRKVDEAYGNTRDGSPVPVVYREPGDDRAVPRPRTQFVPMEAGEPSGFTTQESTPVRGRSPVPIEVEYQKIHLLDAERRALLPKDPKKLAKIDRVGVLDGKALFLDASGRTLNY